MAQNLKLDLWVTDILAEVPGLGGRGKNLANKSQRRLIRELFQGVEGSGETKDIGMGRRLIKLSKLAISSD